MAARIARSLGLLLALAFALPAVAQTRTLVAYVGSYSGTMVYNLDDMVSSGGGFYISLMPGNVGNTPASSASQWVLVGSGSAVGATGAAGANGAAGLMGPQGPQGPAGVAGPTGATGPADPSTSPGVVRETRTLNVAAIKQYNLPAGASLLLFSATGPGNIERIQLAMSYSDGSPTALPLAANMVITIVVDGSTYTAPLGMFMLWDGYTTSDGTSATSDLFESKYLGITTGTSSGNATNSGFRRIYIKYNSSISISLTAAPITNIEVYSQVEYYPGVAPPGRFPATRNVFHMYVNDWATSTIAPNTTLTVLPGVSGAGELESIYFVSSATGPVEPGWLEIAPALTVDGTIFEFGGNEDFFGNQFYGDQFHGRADEYGIARYFSAGAPDRRTYWSGYRYFRESPLLFNASLGITWRNEGAGSGPASQVGTLTVFYTDN